jgi:uncharacterized protein YdeI (YjbR/CyaY-like superfamily)
MNPVDAMLAKTEQWQPEFAKLREIILQTRLDEELKWGQPCYSLDGKNVLLIHGFKEYCAILFMKGALLKNADGLLVAQTEKVQAARQMRFKNLAEIVEREQAILANVQEAIAVEKASLKVEFKETADFALPEELSMAFSENAVFKDAFYALTPGRQRAYIYHFAEPKQAKTRVARIEKNMDRIMDGVGLND